MNKHFNTEIVIKRDIILINLISISRLEGLFFNNTGSHSIVIKTRARKGQNERDNDGLTMFLFSEIQALRSSIAMCFSLTDINFIASEPTG